LSNLSTLRRQRLQRQVALSLEEAFPERGDELASLLGRYFAEAGEGDKAITYLLQAGDAARRIYAYDEAIQAYEQSLLFLREQSDHPRAARILMILGLAYHNVFAYEKSRQAYEEGLQEWRKSGEKSKDHTLPPAPHPFRGVSQQAPASLDTSLTTDFWSHYFIQQLFSRLLEFANDDELVPDMALSWDVLNDGTRYIFHLRENAKWSDGAPVTAADFEYSWKRTLHPENIQGMANLLYDIKGARSYHQGIEPDPDTVGIRVEDTFTLKIDLESPSSYFLQILAHSVTSPVPKHVVERLGTSWIEPINIVTNGPFKIKDWSPEELLLLEKDPNYQGYFKGNLSQIQFLIRPPDSWSGLYERNEIDFVFAYSGGVDMGDRFVQAYPDDYLSLPAAGTQFLAFDVTRQPFDDPRVRQALILAIDLPKVVSESAKGLIFPATGGLVPPGIPGHVPGIALPYDPDLAREKLVAAGYPDGVGFPNVDILIPSNWFHGGILARFAELWKKNLGLDVNWEACDWNEFLTRHFEDKPQMWISGWVADYPDPDSFLRLLLNNNVTGWEHQEYESLVRDARRITDSAQRLAMYRQAERLLVQEAAIVPLTYGRLHLLVKPWISKLPYSTFDSIILKELLIEPHD
jgi:oligopeptide transport system substrate-binding protein